MIGESCSDSELGGTGSDNNINRSVASPSDFFTTPLPSGAGGYAGVAPCTVDTASLVDTGSKSTEVRENHNGETADSSYSPVVCWSEENRNGAKEQTPCTPTPTQNGAQIDPSSSSSSDVSKCSGSSPATSSKRSEVKTSSVFVDLSGGFRRDRAKSESGKDGVFAAAAAGLGGGRGPRKTPTVKTVESIKKSLIK